MTPTRICKTMNKVYEQLKAMTTKEIRQCVDQSYTGFGADIDGQTLFEYQCRETIRRKAEGIW